ncbi:MAG: hypothetical protein HZC14_01240 [Candidatus Niyogibacteria bacterium]|nr:hypothetical protein [Candidatus Niyogibacteria bacterium]
MADGERTTFKNEGIWIVKICAHHGKMFVSGVWLYLPKLVAFLASEQKDANTRVYSENCDERCKCGENYGRHE